MTQTDAAAFLTEIFSKYKCPKPFYYEMEDFFALQYFAFPDYPFKRFRKKAPGRYESYADLKLGREVMGSNGLWTENGTIAYFANLKVTYE